MADQTYIKTVNIPYGKLYPLLMQLDNNVIADIVADDFDPEGLKNYHFTTIKEVDNKPTLGLVQTGRSETISLNGTVVQNTNPQDENQIMKFSFNGDMTGIEEYVFVPRYTDAGVNIYRDAESGKFTIEQNTVDANNIGARPYVYGRDESGNFVRVQGDFSRYSSSQRLNVTDQLRPNPPGASYEIDFVLDNKLFMVYAAGNVGITTYKGNICTSAKWATSEYWARKYLIDGDESGIIDGGEEKEGKALFEELYFRQEYWYGFIPDTTDINSHHVDVWYSDPYTPHEADMDADFYVRYKFNLQDKPNLALYIGTPSSPPDTHASQFFSARLQLYFLERDGVVYDDSDSKPVFIWNMGAGGRFSNMSSIIWGYTPIGIAPNYVISLAEAHGSTEYDLFGANLETNIPIFRTRELAQAYLDGEIGADQAINSIGPNIGANGNRTGHELTSNSYNDVDAAAVCSECLCCTSGAFQEFFDKLFDADNRESILAGLELYGTDTASFIVDTFAVPFDYTVFQDTEAINTLSFGSYHRTFDSTFNRTTKLNPKIVPAFSCSIVGGFNDWRDWQSEYYLALPYVGRNIHINKEVYLYKLLECDVSVDIRTGQIKYFLKCNGIVTDTFEGVCRISMPIQTTNNYSFAREKLGAAASVVTGIIGGAANIATGNIGGAIGNAIGVAESTLDLEKNKPINTTGNCSPANAWNDPLECYLIVQTPEYEYSTNIKNTYGLPANYVGTVGGQSGYVECENVFLKTGATEQEQSEILTLLSNGVII